MSDCDEARRASSTLGIVGQMRDAKWRFWLQWVMANVVGMLALVGGIAMRHIRDSYLLAFGGLVLFAIMQWLALRREIKWAGWWVLATAFSLVVGAILGIVLGLAPPPIFVHTRAGISISDMFLGGPVAGFVAGTLTGVAQWLVLRRQARWAGLWVLASPIAWFLAIAAGRICFDLLGSLADPQRIATPLPVAWMVLGIMYGVTTGLVLARLLPNHEEVRRGWVQTAAFAAIAALLMASLIFVLRDLGFH